MFEEVSIKYIDAHYFGIYGHYYADTVTEARQLENLANLVKLAKNS